MCSGERSFTEIIEIQCCPSFAQNRPWLAKAVKLSSNHHFRYPVEPQKKYHTCQFIYGAGWSTEIGVFLYSNLIYSRWRLKTGFQLRVLDIEQLSIL